MKHDETPDTKYKHKSFQWQIKNDEPGNGLAGTAKNSGKDWGPDRRRRRVIMVRTRKSFLGRFTVDAF
jgi:hypothetical protein